MLIGNAHVSKAAGSQSLDLQRVALQAEGVDADNVLPRRRVRCTRRPPNPRAEARITPASATPTATIAIISPVRLPPHQPAEFSPGFALSSCSPPHL